MGTKNSSWYLIKIAEIEDQIAEEHNLIGVTDHENGDDRLGLEDRINKLINLKTYYESEYKKALNKEGTITKTFLGRMETGN